MKISLSSTFLVICLVAPADFARAQTVPQAGDSAGVAVSRIRATIQSLKPLAGIRASSGAGIVEGHFYEGVRDTLWLKTSTTPLVALPIRNIDALWTRENRIGKGAVVGGAFTGLTWCRGTRVSQHRTVRDR